MFRNDQDIVRVAREIGRVQPDPQATRRALQRARATIAGATRDPNDHRRRYLLMKIAIPSGLAVAALLAVALLLSVHTAQPASASEQFERAIQASEGYRGWVHVEIDDARTRTDGDIHPRVGELHFDTTSGTAAVASESDRGLSVLYFAPASDQAMQYDAATNELRLGVMSRPDAERVAQTVRSQVTPRGVLDHYRQMGLTFEVRHARDGELDRFEAVASGGEGTPDVRRLVLLADPASGLIQRMTTEGREGRTATYRFRYGEPAIADVYALGVPRDAKVVDNRPPQSARELMEGLDRHVADGFGDHVSVLVTIRTIPASPDSNDAGIVRLLASHGERLLSNQYRVRAGPEMGSASFHSLDALPPGWPRPNVAETVEMLDGAPPVMAYVTDGKEAWSSIRASNGELRTQHFTEHQLRLFPAVVQADSGIGGLIWPSPRREGWYGPDAEVELLGDPARPGLVGIRAVTFSTPAPGRRQRQEREIWLDPSRGNVPVEKVFRTFGTDGRSVERESHTEYLDYVQIRPGAWYPSRWREGDREYYLAIQPGMALDDHWYRPPGTP